MASIFLPLGTIHTTPAGDTYVFSIIEQDTIGWRKITDPSKSVIEVADVADVISLMAADYVEEESEDEYGSEDVGQQVRDAITTSLNQFVQGAPRPGDAQE